MIALTDTSSVVWGVFILAVLFFLALDLGVFHRHARVVAFREAMAWTGLWIGCAMAFAFLLGPAMIPSWKREDTLVFVTGYLIELSLSMDNVFVIALIFSYFRVPSELQHRVLFWGILGALVMRGALIGVGVVVIREFQWVLHVMGAFLVFSGVRMIFAQEEEVNPERNIVLRLARRLHPFSRSFHGQRFVTVVAGRRVFTPLALVLVSVETTDLIFAIDSIPAIFGVTSNAFIVFTSNVFAILGLRSLYFVLAGAIGYFRYLKVGLSIVLAFIGVKMLVAPHGPATSWYQLEIPTVWSLGIVLGVLTASVLLSLAAERRERRRQPRIR